MRFILRHRGTCPPTVRELEELLPPQAVIVDDGGYGMFLVEGEERQLRAVFDHRPLWLIAPERFFPHAST
jgi:hypothetical protein